MRRALICFGALLLLALGGCRVRTIDDPGPADAVLSVEETAPVTTPEPSPTPTATPEAEPSPTPTATPDPQPVDTPEAQHSQPDRPSSLDSAGAPLVQEGFATGLTVTYDPNGGESAVVTAAVEPGQPYGLMPTPTWRGHRFDGWWTDRHSGELVTPETPVSREQSHTLYAHWSDKGTDTITFDGNGGRVKAKEVRLELSQGDRYGALPTPLREGYSFLGWFTAPEAGEAVDGDSLFPGGDLTLYAHWAYDPVAFWRFTLRNRTQQVYLCQQVPIYFETEADGVTASSCPLITDTGSQNIADSRDDPQVTDDWVRAKKPAVVVKVSASLDATAQEAGRARFPDQDIILVTPEALADGSAGLYARLALAKHLYGDWYTDVDLSVVARELGVSELPIRF